MAVDSLSLFLILRAFAAGCSAMTGVEAISDGVPAFKEPQASNARTTLLSMVTILAVMFAGISLLAHMLGVVPKADETVCLRSPEPSLAKASCTTSSRSPRPRS